jgi:hypothetical protein
MTDILTISTERAPVVISADPSRATLAITASEVYIRLLAQLIYQGIELWDESELVG